jgi:hypothetical protein
LRLWLPEGGVKIAPHLSLPPSHAGILIYLASRQRAVVGRNGDEAVN